jgi:hypothetical protein
MNHVDHNCSCNIDTKALDKKLVVPNDNLPRIRDTVFHIPDANQLSFIAFLLKLASAFFMFFNHS